MTISIEGDYLLDVVPRESNPEQGFVLAALKAQAVAARSYAFAKIEAGASINNSIQFQSFVPYFFDRQGYYPSNGEHPPTKKIPFGINPCTDNFFTSTNPATREQLLVCQAVADKQYITLSGDTKPFQTDFSADWPNGVSPVEQTAPKVDPISGTKNEPCGVPSEQYETQPNGESPKSHGRGMTQYGANRWARGNRCGVPAFGNTPWSVRWTRPEQILTHYYTGIDIRDVDNSQNVLSPSYRWNPLKIDWGTANRQPPALTAGAAYSIPIQVQNTGVSTWNCAYPNFTYALSYRWTGPESYDGAQTVSLCDLAAGATVTKTLALNDVPDIPGSYNLSFDVAVTSFNGNFRFSQAGWPAYSVGVRVCATTGCVRQLRQRDIAFVIDTTYSMYDDIAAVQASATQIVNAIAASGDDYRVALIDFRDFPYTPYGSTGDYPARVALNFSTDQPTIVSAINGLTIGDGNDWPESVYSGAMAAIDLQWRADAVKTIIIMGDAPPHDPEPNTGYTSDTVTAAANAGGTPIQSGLATLMAMATTTSGTNGTSIQIDPVLIGNDTDAQTAFQQLADGTGGTLFQAATASNVSAAIIDAITTTADAPTANAGGPYSASLGQPITFSAANSYDPDGVVAFYEWDFESDGVFDLVTAEATTTYTYTAPFAGTATLRVTDDSGVSAIATAQVEIAGSIPTATPTPTSTPTPGATVTLYDEVLAPDWTEFWSWDTTLDPAVTTPHYSGSVSYGVTYGLGWAGFRIAPSAGSSDLSNYQALRFAVHGGTTGGQTFHVMAKTDAEVYYDLGEATPVAGQWTMVELPLPTDQDLSHITQLYWQEAYNQARPIFYLDQIELVARSGTVPTSTPAATPTTSSTTPPSTLTPTSTPGGTSSTTVLYNDALTSGWEEFWSWGTDLNEAVATPHYSGSVSYGVTYTSGWAGFRIAPTTESVDWSGYQALRFAVHGGTSGGQTFHVVVKTDAEVYYDLGEVTPLAGQWTVVELPLPTSEDLSHVALLYWQEAYNQAQPTFYLDQIELVAQ